MAAKEQMDSFLSLGVGHVLQLREEGCNISNEKKFPVTVLARELCKGRKKKGRCQKRRGGREGGIPIHLSFASAPSKIWPFCHWDKRWPPIFPLASGTKEEEKVGASPAATEPQHWEPFPGFTWETNNSCSVCANATSHLVSGRTPRVLTPS